MTWDYTFQYYDDADQPVTPLSDLLKDDASKEDNITVCAKVVKVSDPKGPDHSTSEGGEGGGGWVIWSGREFFFSTP